MSYERIIRISRLDGTHVVSTGRGEALGLGFFGLARIEIGEEFGYHWDEIEIAQEDDLYDHFIAVARGEPIARVTVVTKG